MNRPKVRHIPDLIEEHLDELAFLWGQRRAAIGSPDYTVRAFRELEERIEGHARGVLVAGDAARELLEAGLTAKDPLAVFASAYLLLRSGSDADAARIATALADAKDGARESLRDALGHAPVGASAPALQEIVASGTPRAAVAAADALARHGQLAASNPRLDALLRDEDAEVRRDAWRIVARVDVEAAS